MKQVFKIILLIMAATVAQAGENTSSSIGSEFKIQSLIKKQLSEKYDGARVELIGSVVWQVQEPSSPVKEVSLLSDNQRGEASLRFSTGQENSVSYEGTIKFSAFKKAWVPRKRIHPGEALSPEMFVLQDINVAIGAENQMRSLYLPEQTEFVKLEARQTMLENLPVLLTAVQKTPDVRRGDTVMIEVQSGGTRLSTQAVVQEPGYLGEKVRVISRSTKKDLVGVLTSQGHVEVSL